MALISHLIRFLCKTCQKPNWNDDDGDDCNNNNNNNNKNDNNNNNNNNSNNNGALTFTIPVFSNKFLWHKVLLSSRKWRVLFDDF